jgi:hypothetical protein
VDSVSNCGQVKCLFFFAAAILFILHCTKIYFTEDVYFSKLSKKYRFQKTEECDSPNTCSKFNPISSSGSLAGSRGLTDILTCPALHAFVLCKQRITRNLTKNKAFIYSPHFQNTHFKLSSSQYTNVQFQNYE